MRGDGLVRGLREGDEGRIRGWRRFAKRTQFGVRLFLAEVYMFGLSEMSRLDWNRLRSTTVD